MHITRISWSNHSKDWCLWLYFCTLLLMPSGVNGLLAQVQLPRLFGDHMVLQRDEPIPIWGKASIGEEINIRFDGKQYQSLADEHGKWQTTLDAHPAGGPYDICISGQDTTILNDALIGDVWVCSGQSNMQWQVRQTSFTESDSNFISRNHLRFLTVQIDTDYLPRDEIKGGQWEILSTENLNKFSAVAYHFGSHLERALSVPIGLISSNLGATTIETWMSNEALLQFEQFAPDIEPIVASGRNFAKVRNQFDQIKEDWEMAYYLRGPGIEGDWHLPTTDLKSWKKIKAPSLLEAQGLYNFDGAVWYRKSFDLPDDFKKDTLMVSLGQIDDYDITWVNGTMVGETYGRHNHRTYSVARSLLRKNNNVLVIRAFDLGGIGGFSTNAFWAPPMVHGTWLMKSGYSINSNTFPVPQTVNVSPFSSPGVLFNANIAPLTQLAVKGVIWYQGEGNVMRAAEYRDLFPELIHDWRNKWNRPGLPFLFVQLANYYPENESPSDSEWAELREAQALALEVDHTGMAVTIDIGEAQDIHPKNKREVGVRLAKSALGVVYGKDNEYVGPTYKSMRVENNKVVVIFDHVGSGLVTRDKYGYIRGFALAGKDQQFFWAKAELSGNEVVVTSKHVDLPVAVRYAWSNNPGAIDLYNKEGLPVVPFRTDSWPLTTAGNSYDFTIPRF
ncbi:MAG: 9-O-acetylesterase [Saprospiraceae bacterium]|nr:9-O-acetylesterase [Saprospiraceae bacterium]